MQAGSAAWPSAPTASTWPAAAGTEQLRSGTPAPTRQWPPEILKAVQPSRPPHHGVGEAPEHVAHIQLVAAQIQPRKSFRLLAGHGYEGEVAESGFTLRRISTGGKGDSKPAIAIRGHCHAAGEGTEVAVTLRHGLLVVSFGWLLTFLAVVV